MDKRELNSKIRVKERKSNEIFCIFLSFLFFFNNGNNLLKYFKLDYKLKMCVSVCVCSKLQYTMFSFLFHFLLLFVFSVFSFSFIYFIYIFH